MLKSMLGKQHQKTAALIFVAALTFGGVAFAQSNLPPEARAQIIISEVESALARRDEAGALRKLADLNAVGVARPANLYITEAKLAGRAKDYARAKAALDKYFKAVPTSDASYKEAAQIYAALNGLEEQEKTRAEAADAVALRTAQMQNTCSSFLSYLHNASVVQRVNDALEAMDKLGCTVSGATAGLSQVARYAAIKRDDARKYASLIENGRAWETAARTAGLEGRWLFDDSLEPETAFARCRWDTVSPEFGHALVIQNGAVSDGLNHYLANVKSNHIDSLLHIGGQQVNVSWAVSGNQLTKEVIAPPGVQFARSFVDAAGSTGVKKLVPPEFVLRHHEFYVSPSGRHAYRIRYVRCGR